VKADPAAARQATVSGRLAQHVVATRLEDIPAAAIVSSKRLALDTLAVAWAGSSAPGVREARDLLAEEGGKPDSTVWAYGG
jgi:2-methylcitrate dehydratase PrpD